MGFASGWLALREPADLAARDPGLLAAAARAAGLAPVIVDLGCGTGAMRRAMTGLIDSGAHWRQIDNDPELLAEAAAAPEGKADVRLQDLSEIDALPIADATLVTASALLDLASRDWLERLADRMVARGTPLYAGLSYDGQMQWDPPHPADAAITEAFNRHQQGDKGLGPALGPAATETAAQIFRTRGYRAEIADSPWLLGPAAALLQSRLLEGIAQAAAEAGATESPDWLSDRLEALARTRCRIGHRDLLALAPESAPPEGD